MMEEKDEASMFRQATVYMVLAVLALSIVLLVTAPPGYAEDTSFAAFKLLGERTDCTVARLAGRSPATNQAPSRFARIAEGERLNDEEAHSAYQCARGQIEAAYRRSGLAAMVGYQDWPKFSRLAYASATHGNRYVNNYANLTAAAEYADIGSDQPMPVGSVLAKDSFFVDADGYVYVGPLAVMEKMYRGYNPAFDNWRFTLILADGNVFRSAGALRSASVAFCGSCHRVSPGRDSLYFLPEAYHVDRSYKN